MEKLEEKLKSWKKKESRLDRRIKLLKLEDFAGAGCISSCLVSSILLFASYGVASQYNISLLDSAKLLGSALISYSMGFMGLVYFDKKRDEYEEKYEKEKEDSIKSHPFYVSRYFDMKKIKHI